MGVYGIYGMRLALPLRASKNVINKCRSLCLLVNDLFRCHARPDLGFPTNPLQSKPKDRASKDDQQAKSGRSSERTGYVKHARATSLMTWVSSTITNLRKASKRYAAVAL
ncbi:hypothetical protein VDGL01_10286 [Verticillium dahliae]